jgi:hypothetical protein
MMMEIGTPSSHRTIPRILKTPLGRLNTARRSAESNIEQDTAKRSELNMIDKPTNRVAQFHGGKTPTLVEKFRDLIICSEYCALVRKS